jgi:hypothetical protein
MEKTIIEIIYENREKPIISRLCMDIITDYNLRKIQKKDISMFEKGTLELLQYVTMRMYWMSEKRIKLIEKELLKILPPCKSLIREDEVLICIDWLQKQKLIKTFNAESYGLKHRVEREYKTYVSNDSFIEAVKRLEIPYKDIYPNIIIGISNKG